MRLPIGAGARCDVAAAKVAYTPIAGGTIGGSHALERIAGRNVDIHNLRGRTQNCKKARNLKWRTARRRLLTRRISAATLH